MVSCSAHVLGYPREQVLRQGTVREKTVIGKHYKTIGKTTFWVVGQENQSPSSPCHRGAAGTAPAWEPHGQI